MGTRAVRTCDYLDAVRMAVAADVELCVVGMNPEVKTLADALSEGVVARRSVVLCEGPDILVVVVRAWVAVSLAALARRGTDASSPDDRPDLFLNNALATAPPGASGAYTRRLDALELPDGAPCPPPLGTSWFGGFPSLSLLPYLSLERHS